MIGQHITLSRYQLYIIETCVQSWLSSNCSHLVNCLLLVLCLLTNLLLAIIDTTLRDGLRKVLTHIGIPLLGQVFHTFRRSGATLAYDNNIQLQHVMAHSLWRSAAVWTYLQNASLAPSIIPTTFVAIIPHNL